MVKGPNVLKGYWQNPQETGKQLEKDGWLHTGDLVSVDKKGFVTIYGRSKDLINRGGLKIYPSELEADPATPGRFPGVYRRHAEPDPG